MSLPIPTCEPTPRDDDRLARVALGTLGEPGDARMVGLVAQLGAVRVRERLIAQRDIGDGLAADVALRLAATDPERDLEHARRLGIRFVIPGDEEWPARLDDLATAETLDRRGGPPLGLWVRGPMRLDELTRSVAVVGSRSATSYGTSVAAELAAATARAGYAVVSGGAFGVDQAAHRGALAVGGRTVAVLACGVDRSYPAAHRRLLEHLAETSAVVSELAPGRSPTRIRFLTRNRLIAALTAGTVVVEAAIRSGALSTAGWAERLHRPLMGVPGPVTAAQSEGVHQLVRKGSASLVTRGEEVLELIGASGDHLLSPRRGRVDTRDQLSRRHQAVLDAVPKVRPAPVDAVARTAGISLVDVQSALRQCERAGLVERSAAGWRISPTMAAESAESPAEGAELPTMGV